MPGKSLAAPSTDSRARGERSLGRMAYCSLADAHVRVLRRLGLPRVGNAGRDRP